MVSQQTKGRSITLTQEGSKRQRVANKSNRSARGRVSLPTCEASKKARDSMAT